MVKKKMTRPVTIKEFISKNYQWIIGLAGLVIGLAAILVSVFVVPWGISLNQDIQEQKDALTFKKTETFYFTPAVSIDLDKVIDGAECYPAISSNRTDSFRCFVGSVVYDPCFLQPSVGYVDCPDDPVTHKILTVSDSTPINEFGSRTGEPYPWYVVLEGGIKCSYLTGMSTLIIGSRVDYGCENEAVLTLPIDKSQSIQKIKCYNKTYERVEDCNIKETWY